MRIIIISLCSVVSFTTICHCYLYPLAALSLNRVRTYRVERHRQWTTKQSMSSLNRFIDDNIMPFFNGNKDGSSSYDSSGFDYRPNDSLMSWTQLNDRLLAVETPSERVDYNLKLVGKGPANAKATLRLFAEAEGYEPEIILYRDTAAWCPYCEKVWLYLEEKQIPYRIVKVPLRCYGEKPRSFFQLNPGGGLPVAVIRGRTMAESNDIMFHIESLYPTVHPMIPDKNNPSELPLFNRMQTLMQLERQTFSVWFRWLTSDAGEASARQMDAVLRSVDKELSLSSGGPYFLGSQLSMVDILFTPFLERMAASLPYYKGFEVRSPTYPHLLRWFEAMDTRPAYQGIKSDYYSHCHDLPPQIGHCYSLPQAEKYRRRIDGDDWDTNKAPVDCFEPMLPRDERIAQEEVLREVLRNHAAIVRFSLRAGHSNGIVLNGPGVSAPLADPNASACESHFSLMDDVLRSIMSDILSSIDPHSEEDSSSSSRSSLELPPPSRPVAQRCLFYLRDRIGVPRDLSVHAAKVYRSAINRFVQQKCSGGGGA